MSSTPCQTPRRAVTVRATRADDGQPFRAPRVEGVTRSPTPFGAVFPDVGEHELTDRVGTAAKPRDEAIVMAERNGAPLAVMRTDRGRHSKTTHHTAACPLGRRGRANA